MKYLILLLTLVSGLRLSAAVTVYDPAVLAKIIESLTTANAQLEIIRQVAQRWGDPAEVQRIEGMQAVIQNTLNPILSLSLQQMQMLSTGASVFNPSTNGLFVPVKPTITLPDGQSAPRALQRYKAFEALDQTANNFLTVQREVEQRRSEMLAALKTTLEQCRSATTMSELQKLHVTALGQSSVLQDLERQLDAAVQNTLVQHLQNQNQEAIKKEALKEESGAVFEAHSRNLRKVFKFENSPGNAPNGNPQSQP